LVDSEETNVQFPLRHEVDQAPRKVIRVQPRDRSIPAEAHEPLPSLRRSRLRSRPLHDQLEILNRCLPSVRRGQNIVHPLAGDVAALFLLLSSCRANQCLLKRRIHTGITDGCCELRCPFLPWSRNDNFRLKLLKPKDWSIFVTHVQHLVRRKCLWPMIRFCDGPSHETVIPNQTEPL